MIACLLLIERRLHAFTTAEVLSNEVLPPGKLKASMPDADGYVTVRGGVGLTYGGATVLIINRTKNIVLTVIANEDGSFEGRIRANISDEIVVQVKDLLGNTTTLSTGLMQNPDGTAAVGPKGGTIYGPGGIVAAIPEGAFDEAISIQITMMPEEVVKDVVMHPELVSGGVFKLDTGGVTANKEIKVSIPAPAWITPDHQILLTKVENIRGYEELSLSCPAVLKDGKLVSTSPPFDGVYQNGMYRFVSWADASKGVAFVEVDAWVTRDVYTQSYVTGDYYLIGSVPFQKRRMMVVTLPVNRPFDIDLKSLEGEKLASVSVQGPPAKGQFYPQVVQLLHDSIPPTVFINSIQDGAEGVLLIENIIIELSEEIDYRTVDQNLNPDAVVVTDSHGNRVPGTFYLAADGKTIVFVPTFGYTYGETYTITLNGVKDLGGNAITSYSSTFKTFNPNILGSISIPNAFAIDKYRNFIAVDSWHYEGVCSTPHSRITILDVTDPAQPQKRGETLLYQTVYDIKALPEEDKIVTTGFRQYCTPKSKRGLIEVVDVSDPAAPREALPFTGGVYLSWAAGSEEPPPNVPYQFGEPVEAALIGTNAFVANSGLGVQAIDLTQLTPPEEAAQASAIGGTFTTATNTNPNTTMLDLFPSVSKAGTKILALKYDRLIILSPQLTAMGVLSGLNHAYSVTGVGSFPIDIDNDGNIGTFEDNDGDPTTSQQETFDLALISTSDGIVIANVTVPANPEIIAQIPLRAGKIVVNRAKRLAYASDGSNLYAISLRHPEGIGLTDMNKDLKDDRIIATLPNLEFTNAVIDVDDLGRELLYCTNYSKGLVYVVDLNIPRLKITLLDENGQRLFDSRKIIIKNDIDGNPVMPVLKARIMPVDPKDQNQVLYITDPKLSNSEICWNVKVEYNVELPAKNAKRSRHGLKPSGIKLGTDGFILNDMNPFAICQNGIKSLGPELEISNNGPLTWGDKFGGGTLTISAAILRNDMPMVDSYNGRIEGERATDQFRTQMIAYLKNAGQTLVTELGSTDVLFALACVETYGINHFWPSKYGEPKGSIYPIENSIGDGGFGVVQLTEPAPMYRQIWHWKDNVDSGVQVVKDKIGVSKSQSDSFNQYQKRMNVYSLFRGGYYWKWALNPKTKKSEWMPRLDKDNVEEKADYLKSGVYEADKAVANESRSNCQ